ncbi:MAG: flagellar hook-basal body protein [Lachnospiraceae bacterium]|jgi:flagellar basal-body rod protein FlgG|nr:flagellar hook-basal body protein [Lachnospiraceae bacterium]
MVRSLWTAATGMIAQQNNVDTIANNLANVNTTGYKTEVAEFKSLLYQDIQAKTTSGNGETKPVGAQVGLGVRNSSVTSRFTQGNFYDSTNDLAFAVSGDGFFGIRGQDGNTYYTRNGDFHLATYGKGLALSTSDGNLVLDTNGKAIELGSNILSSKLTISGDGELCYPDETNNPKSLGITIGLWQFNNPSGLEKIGDSSYSVTAASGPAMNENTTQGLTKSDLRQGYLEGSNVQVVDEMVNMIVAQRAYELNSKAIQATDEMMGQANSLRR